VTPTAIAEPAASTEHAGAPEAEAQEQAKRERIPDIVRRRLAPFDARLDAYSWAAAGVITLIAAIIRLVGLTYPKGKMFDELYYATEAWAMLQHGVEWDLENNTAKYVVHPPLGKWCIALGEAVFGNNELGWRISAAVVGIASVLMITRIARRMFGSTALGCAAGLLMALDGMHFVLSRTSLLDIFLMFFVLAAFGFLVLNRDARRRRWLAHMESGADPGRPGPTGRPRFDLRTGVPWHLLAAAVMAGAALGVKWSAVFYLPVFALLAFFWEVGARRSAGVRRPWRDTLLDETGWFALSTLLIVLTYLASWTGWFLNDSGYGRHRMETEHGWGGGPITALWNLFLYHRDALGFHTTLTSTHPYQSWPWQWLIQGRPVAFYWNGNGPCGASSCASEVLLLGTPILWWSFLLVLPLLIWFGIARRDWRMPPIALGIAAGIVPWFYYAADKRTMFYFYAIPAEPFLILATVFVLGALMTSPAGRVDPAVAANRRMVGAIVAGGYVVLVALCFAYFYPVYTGQILTYAEWSARMWLGNRWI
jgi:dolichyl-phosphate-mannose--protein O-mannosyl transferase